MNDVKVIKQLLECGVHFGHQTNRWNPKMRKYIFGEKSGIYIIDLLKTKDLLEKARIFLHDVARAGSYILYVGTKKQAQAIVRAEAERAGMFYVNQRWLGGTLTNFSTVRKSITKLDNLEKSKTDGTYEAISKKERSQRDKMIEKLLKNLGGIRKMNRLPGAVFVIDSKKEEIAVREARKLGIPVIALIDTNSDPDMIDYVVPGNDDALKSIALITSLITESIVDGRGQFMAGSRAKEEEARKQSADKEEGNAPVEERPKKIEETMEKKIKSAEKKAKEKIREKIKERAREKARVKEKETASDRKAKPVK